MYSDNIQKIFKHQEIAVGDLIRVEKAGSTYQGELMPSSESSDPQSIIIKLASGYNIGITYAEDVKVTRLETSKRRIEFPHAAATPKAGLPKVSLIYTGGTIGSRVDYVTGGVYMLAKPEELLFYVPEISQIANISIVPLMSIASEDMSHFEWQKLANAVADELNRGARGIVITHGTDTMHYSAAALSFMLHGLNAPVILTGSQRSSDRGSSDAFMNLTCATTLAAQSDIAEVAICMHNSSSDDKCAVIRGVKARKMHTSRRDAFKPINDYPLAYVERTGKIGYNSNYKKTTNTLSSMQPQTKYEGRVALVKMYPGADPDVINYYRQKDYKGIIIEGTGLGHAAVSTSHDQLNWLPAITDAVKSGMVIGVTSQCIFGRVNPNVYRNLRLMNEAGAIYCEDMTSETALVKLGWLLGNHKSDKAKQLLTTNIVGEIAQRTVYDEFQI